METRGHREEFYWRSHDDSIRGPHFQLEFFPTFVEISPNVVERIEASWK